MKKMLSMLLVLSILLGCSAAMAEDMGVQIISGPSMETEPISLDDMKINQTATIPGYADVTILESDFYNEILEERGYYQSGPEADYLVLTVRILNTTKAEQSFIKLINNIICTFNDEYQFAGWVRQWKSDSDNEYKYGEGEGHSIMPLYTGKYAVVITLPNYVVESKAPISVTFNLGENEITYQYRK